MPDLIRKGAAWLAERLVAHASQTVTYTRGAQSVQVPAVLGRKLLRIEDEVGSIRFEYTDMDFIIPTAALDFGSGPIEPERGDWLSVMTGEQVDTFQAFPFAGEPVWSFTDPNQSMRRIRAKLIDHLGGTDDGLGTGAGEGP